MNIVWLVDATSYVKFIDPELLRIKQDYFRIKNYVREKVIGTHVLPTQRTFSTGLLRIATLLHRQGYYVKFFHLNDYLKQDIGESLNDEKPYLVAFGCVCPTIPICNRLAQQIKEYNAEIITAVGGAHINVALELTKKRYTSFDRYVYGYDKDAVSRLINHKVGDDIDYHPYVEYSLLPYPLNEYDINIFTTLGCPFNCAYCQDGQMPYYEYLEDGGLGQIQKTIKPNKLVHFFDSTLGCSENRIIKICEALKRIEHKCILSCDLRAEFISQHIITALENAGFKEIRIGLETVDKEVLERNNRRILPEEIMRKIDIVRNNSGIYLTLYTVSGLPGFTLDTYKRNRAAFEFLLESRKVDEIKNAQYVPYPRDGFDFSQRGIIIKNNDWECYDRQSYPVYETLELTQQEIWNEYLDTARSINKAWLKGWKLQSVDELNNRELYPEYIVGNYLEGNERHE